MIQAFPYLTNKEYKSNDLKKIFSKALYSKTYDIFLNEIKLLDSKWNLDDFILYDKAFNDANTQSFTHTFEQYRYYKKLKGVEVLDSIPNYSIKDPDLIAFYQSELCGNEAKHTIFSWASFFSSEIENGKEVFHAIQTYRSYNNKLKYFIEAFCYYCNDETRNGKMPKKNDLQDLFHFLYLFDNVAIKIVSNDKLIGKICGELFPRKYISPLKFLSRR
jgi:hypothetical protein